MRRSALIPVIVFALLLPVFAQEQPTPKPPLNPIARLRAAKTAYLKDGGGNDFPYRKFESSLEGWGRFALVNSPEKADIIVEIAAPSEGSGISVSSSTMPNNPLGTSGEQTVKTTKQFSSVQQITVTVYDARSNVRLWSASEKPKSALKQRAKEENLSASTNALFAKFRELIEPTPAQ